MNNSRLYNITTIGCLLLFGIYLFLCSDYVRAEETDTVTTASAICAASNGLIAHHSDSEIILEEGLWWLDFLKDWTENADASEVMVTSIMKNLQSRYSSGELSWSELIDLAEACNPLRSELASNGE